ncbi:transposon Tf2-6 polyprotein [Trichonephila clavipes]|nr:transposon Tf2-6 polyprotein [Trichonephila clavipes]
MFRVTTIVLLLTLATCQLGIPTPVFIHLFLAMVVATLDLENRNVQNAHKKKESASVNAIHMFTCLTSPVALLDIEVYEATGTVCADTGASQSIGGELMFKFLRNREQKFSEFHLAMCLADGQQSTSLVHKATVPITVGERTFQIDLIFCHMQR